jgi:hypothetical protein
MDETTTTPAPVASGDSTPTTQVPVASSPTTAAPVVTVKSTDPVLQGLLDRLAQESTDTDSVSPLEIHKMPCTEVTVAELKAAIAANPSHSVAPDWAKGIKNLPDTYKVNVHTADLQAILTGKSVIRQTNIVNGETVVTKTLS